jgi:hypothetical protein
MRVVVCVSFDRDKEREGLYSATVRPKRKNKLEGEKSLSKFDGIVWMLAFVRVWLSCAWVDADDARDDGMAWWEVTVGVRSGLPLSLIAFSRVTSRFKET